MSYFNSKACFQVLLLILSNHFIQPIITWLLLFQIIEKLKENLEMLVTVWIFPPFLWNRLEPKHQNCRFLLGVLSVNLVQPSDP